jgi:hypothetical protein
MVVVNKKTISLLLSGLLFLSAMAEDVPKTPLLERVITITLEQESLASALKKIGQSGGFSFSYSSDVLDASRIVSYQFKNKTVREILDQLFQGNVAYKERKKYIILTRAEVSSSKNTQQVTGYVVDEATGERMKNVSVYDPVSMASVVTNDYGYFQIEVPKPSNAEVRLAINKQNYTDTVFVVAPDKKGLVNIQLKEEAKKIGVVADSLGKKMKRFWLSTKAATEQAINMENIDDTLHRGFQFAVIPFAGTNGKLSGNVINDYSLNLFGGYSLGINQLEISGLFSVVRGNVKGVQIAGLANGVAGETEGLQIAGLANGNLQSVKGVQIAGLANVNWEHSKTVAVAGLVNYAHKGTRGLKIAGLANVSLNELDGPALAGLFNFSNKDANPLGIAGLFNFTAASINGVQIGGLMNYAEKIEGTQVTAGVNITGGEMRGLQLGILNVASKMKGMQIGIINVADSVKGLPIGLFSFISHGYHKLEISADEIFYTNLSFRTGVRQFYTLLIAGAKPQTFEDPETLWTFGYGIGTAPRISRTLSLNIDLISTQVALGGNIEAINLINKLYLGLEFQLAPKFGLTAGATLNGYVTDSTHDNYPDIFADYQPNIVYDHTYSNDLNLKMWWGAKVGLRFF